MKALKIMKKHSQTDFSIEESSGNVFKDLKVVNPEEFLMKAKLAFQIKKIIDKKELTQKEAANLLGLDQPKISALCRGRLTGFSYERLFKLLAILNQDIEIIIKPHYGRKIHPIPHMSIRFAAG